MSQRPANFGINRDSPLAKGLVFAGLGNAFGRSTLFDSSWRGNHAALTNMDPATDWVWVPELGRWGLDLAGGNECASIVTSGMSFASNEASFAVWVKLVEATPVDFTNTGIANLGTSQDSHYPYTNGLVYLEWFRSSRVNGITPSTTVDRTAWHLVAATTSPGANGFKFYQAGNLVYQTTGLAAVSIRNPAYMGGTTAYGLRGMMADPMIFSRALSLSEISALADPSNALLEVGGRPLILPPRRRFLPAAVVEEATPTTLEMPVFSITI